MNYPANHGKAYSDGEYAAIERWYYKDKRSIEAIAEQLGRTKVAILCQIQLMHERKMWEQYHLNKKELDMQKLSDEQVKNLRSDVREGGLSGRHAASILTLDGIPLVEPLPQFIGRSSVVREDGRGIRFSTKLGGNGYYYGEDELVELAAWIDSKRRKNNN